MKQLLISIACLCLTLSLWAAWPTTKMITSPSPAKSDWVKVQDDCGKCVMDDVNRKCGKCGGFMAEDGKKGKPVKGSDGHQYYQQGYKCKQCGHPNIYRYRTDKL